ncbi:putative lipopolysaccharide heptosyltransferase III [Desulfosarcina sp. OttesenSCG-928-B08]|nr:putative lipopolysaccharide heptosyltransferase III [Desulfosarcina sp. OttesenSCG-928-B08]
MAGEKENTHPDMMFVKKTPPRILVIKMRYIGDTVLTTPLLRALKDALPQAEICFLVNQQSADIVKNQPFSDRLIVFDNRRTRQDIGYFFRFVRDLRRLKCDVALDLTRNDRSALLTFLSGAKIRMGYEGAGVFQKNAYTHEIPYHFGNVHTVDHHLEMAAALGIPIPDRHPYLAVTDSDRDAVRNVLHSKGISEIQPFMLIHPGARRWYKSWPVERFIRLADRIADHYPVQIVLSGGPEDQDTCHAIFSGMTHPALNLCGKIPLGQLPALIQDSILLIGNDSAPIHIATAVETPAIALFGPTRWEDWQPRREQDTTLSAAFDCRPCGHSRSDCPYGRLNYCMSTISEESVWEAVQKTLAASSLCSQPRYGLYLKRSDALPASE